MIFPNLSETDEKAEAERVFPALPGQAIPSQIKIPHLASTSPIHPCPSVKSVVKIPRLAPASPIHPCPSVKSVVKTIAVSPYPRAPLRQLLDLNMPVFQLAVVRLQPDRPRRW